MILKAKNTQKNKKSLQIMLNNDISKTMQHMYVITNIMQVIMAGGDSFWEEEKALKIIITSQPI